MEFNLLLRKEKAEIQSYDLMVCSNGYNKISNGNKAFLESREYSWI